MLNAPELYAMLPFGRHFPATDGSQCFRSGMQSKTVAISSAVYTIENKKMLPLVNALILPIGENTRP